MNWAAAGAIGEILGAAVVAVTLIYLSVQVRATRRAAMAESTSKGVELHSNWRMTYLQNSELAEVLAKANEGDELSSKEKSQLHFLAHELFVSSSFSYTFAEQSGAIYEVDGNATYLVDILIENPALEAKWHEFKLFLDRFISRDFCSKVDRELARIASEESSDDA